VGATLNDRHHHGTSNVSGQCTTTYAITGVVRVKPNQGVPSMSDPKEDEGTGTDEGQEPESVPGSEPPAQQEPHPPEPQRAA